jgi:hypothetical protein
MTKETLNKIYQKSNELILEVKLKECFKTIYKIKINANDFKKLASVLRYLEEGYGLKIREAMSYILKEKEEEKSWFQ